MNGSTVDRLHELLADGVARSVTEIHAVIGPCRLNSRACELRKRLRREGADLICEHVKGRTGPDGYVYRITAAPVFEAPLPQSVPADVAADAAGTQLSLLAA